ncbi:NAD(P)-dependent oxidoreductase [Sphingomonas koreensis]|jgi:UDP-glucose 4-epimerase|uniref:NAD(P)-dependent oxidoreductase n=3 Tax=Sphingomonas koreensis TaxID=93064 RepID=A0A1L6JDN4_9SPHN|nr:NAD(P)-dependent oxidoreductase [Sphingomonas koreensis]APR53600.1 NAD-dependent epimerase/dehydratase [Sphingomonas koreensis]MDC7809670.1 NAD(P)-dependent oxidoreductase [Sphingomonas koreensis]RSU34587.1 NAD(P)-dependent oxidoreductase [Sphingomonas koreensis]RSU75369.1 NAD(P)-dependent oxidoreductase [Sphingomonas koreensis]RSU76376.1 NAD(P)-dependent oxidoreductase [Sphingomonas koreensis]
MHILLTGSSGWLGRYLAPMLRGAGHEVTGLDVAPGVDTDVVGSVADAALIERVFGEYGIEAVIHGGALHKPDIVRYSKQTFVDVNVTGTLNLLEAAVRAGHDRFVSTSTTSLMISQAIRDEAGDAAVWLDEDSGPIEPRNIYGTTKYAAEQLCRLFHAEHGLNSIVLRTGRFFPEEDDTHSHPPGENLKANEFLHRRLTVEDAARAHVAALEKAPEMGFATYLVSAPTPFARGDAAELKHDAASVIARYFPDAPGLYAARGWVLPERIGRVYDSGRIVRELGFRFETGFPEILAALRDGAPLPFEHDADYISPKEVA